MSRKRVQGHACHWPGCGRKVEPRFWGCTGHWFTLPKEIRARIWATYRPGQEIDKRPSADYVEAAKAAQAWILAHQTASLFNQGEGELA